MSDNILTRALAWLRAGYPDGIPTTDYVALLGVLHRELTDAEIARLAHEVREAGGIDKEVSEAAIAQAIEAHILQRPTAEDIQRVRARLTAGGWPLSPDETSEQG